MQLNKLIKKIDFSIKPNFNHIQEHFDTGHVADQKFSRKRLRYAKRAACATKGHAFFSQTYTHTHMWYNPSINKPFSRFSEQMPLFEGGQNRGNKRRKLQESRDLEVAMVQIL